VRALLVAAECHMALGRPLDADRDLKRASEASARQPTPADAVRIANAEARLMLHRRQLAGCRRMCQRNLRDAAQAGTVDGTAGAALLLAQVLRLLGRRREAEHQAQAALTGFELVGDLARQTEAALVRGVLAAERGDHGHAKPLLDDVVRRLRGASSIQLYAAGIRGALSLAILRGDTAEGSHLLGELEQHVDADPEAPATIARWWRTRGDIDRALGVAVPSKDRGFGRALWHIERSRAALTGALPDVGRTEAREALALASELELSELALHARLLSAVHDTHDDGRWRDLLRQATESLSVEIYLGALEMDARRAIERGDLASATTRWRNLRARAEELGYRPGVEEATGWLAA
jgi:tetratricopeptide (TPR) repeat protein